MKVIHLSTSDSGGAGRATFRIHQSLLDLGVNSEIWVNVSKTKEKTVISNSNKITFILSFLRRYAKIPLISLLKTNNLILHSPAILPSPWIKKINESTADIVNLHWTQHEMLSISDISKINKPLVWTLHDMWGFCGAEHISWDDRWEKGYNKNNRPPHESGFDLNKWTWKRKIKYWKKPIQIITPSNWLTQCVKKSKLMKDWPVETIPHPINFNFWKSVDKKNARKMLGLPEDKILIAFGSSDANYEYHKGFDLLLSIIKKISIKNLKFVHLVVFGQKKKINLNLDLPIHSFGYLNDLSLKTLYSSVDAIVIPSRIESFGQIASEASACETPVIAFKTGGLQDVINHLSTGYLAEKFDIEDFAKGIDWVLKHKDNKKLGFNGRNHVQKNFNGEMIALNYLDIYNKVCKY